MQVPFPDDPAEFLAGIIRGRHTLGVVDSSVTLGEIFVSRSERMPSYYRSHFFPRTDILRIRQKGWGLVFTLELFVEKGGRCELSLVLSKANGKYSLRYKEDDYVLVPETPEFTGLLYDFSVTKELLVARLKVEPVHILDEAFV